MFPTLRNCQRRSLLTLFLVTAIGCGDSDVPKASIPGQIAAATTSTLAPERLLGAWIVGEGFQNPGDDVAARMQQGIAEGSCRFEFKAGNRVDILLGGGTPVQTGQWQVVGSNENALSIQIVAPEVYGSAEPCVFNVVFHDQDHLTMQQAGDDAPSFYCTRLRR